MPVDITYVEETLQGFQRPGDIPYRLEILSGYRFESVQITTLTLTTPIQGSSYTENITAIGGSEVGYTWELISGTIPTGLTLAASGTPTTTLSGIPLESGVFTFTVRVTDDAGNVDDQAYTFTIEAVVSVSVQFVPLGAGGLNGGNRLSVISQLNVLHDLGAQLTTATSYSAPASWDIGAGWTYRRGVGLTGQATNATADTEIRTTAAAPVPAGDCEITVSQFTSGNTDCDFGIEWQTGSASARFVLRGSGNTISVVLETEISSIRRVIRQQLLTALPSAVTPIALRLVYISGQVFGFLNSEFVAQGRFVASTLASELHLITRSRTAAQSTNGQISKVVTKSAVSIDGNLAQVATPTTATQALQIIVPRGRDFSRLGLRTAVLAGYFGEVELPNAFTYLPPLRNILTRSGIVRRG